MPTDAELLQRYARERDERAFAELVQRHLGMVYGAALRRTGGRSHVAEEVTQRVFADLARKAAALSHHPALTGWLHRSTRYVAIDAARLELRGEKIAQALAAMPETNFSPGDQVEWEQLRPAIDAAIDQLKEGDREVMLLRYFEGLSFVEIGSRMGVSENAVRMRTERALEKLRGHLGRRGVTSTAAALGLVLANSAFASAPKGLAASVTSSAFAAAPAGSAFATFILMSKIVTPAVGAALSVGVTALIWTFIAPGVSIRELAGLRAENTRLKESTANGNDAEIADQYAVQVTTMVATVSRRVEERNAAGAGQHRNHGQATPRDAFLSYGWAMDAGEVTALAGLMTYEEKGRASIQAIYASMPGALRGQYSTPEELMAFFFVADTLLSPVPGADVGETFVATAVGPGRALLHRPGAKGGMNFVQTDTGWKCVVPDRYPEVLARRIMGSEMLAELGIR